jgi:peptide/nickel transport system permease protein
MWGYALRRCLWMIPTLLGVTLVCFVLLRMADVDPAMAQAQDQLRGSQISRQAIAQLRQLYGLNLPWYIQYGRLLSRLLTLDLGNAWQNGRPIVEIIAEALPVTLVLTTVSISLAYLISVPLGVYSAVKHGTLMDQGVTLLLFMLYSLPAFWFGTVLLVFLASGRFVSCAWLPAHACFPLQGFHSFDGWSAMTRWQQLKDVTWHSVLPVVTLTYPAFAVISRYTRAEMLDTLQQDYIRTARAKGLSQRAVLFGHALRNSLLPIVTLLGLELPELVGGSVIVESIFGVRGMGLTALEAARMPDYPLVISLVFLMALVTMLGTLGADLVYAWLDPRIRYNEG